MTDRHWVGGTASWDGTAGTKWALTNGGAGGQAVPTNAEDVFFDSGSGAATITQSGARVCKSLTCTGFTGTFAGSGGLTVSGDLLAVSGMSWTNTSTVTFDATASITCGTKTLGGASGGVTINGVGITATFQDAFVCAGTLTLTNGTLTANNQTVSCGAFSSNNSNTRVLTLGSGTWTLAGTGTVWNTQTTTGLTFNANTAAISITGTTANQRTFTSGALTFGGNLSVGANSNSAALFFNQDVTFPSMSVTAPRVITLSVVLTLTTAPTWTGDLTASPLQIMGGSAGTTGTISIASGTMSISGAFIRDIACTGGATFTATSSYDLKGNSGITITPPSSSGGISRARAASGF